MQALLGDLRANAIERIAEFVKPGGWLLVIARSRVEGEPESEGPTWPLTRHEMDGFQRAGLQVELYED